MLVLENNKVDLMKVELEMKSVNDSKEYYVNVADNGSYPITKDFYEELEYLFKCNSVVFKDYIKTMLKLLPELVAA